MRGWGWIYARRPSIYALPSVGVDFLCFLGRSGEGCCTLGGRSYVFWTFRRGDRGAGAVRAVVATLGSKCRRWLFLSTSLLLCSAFRLPPSVFHLPSSVGCRHTAAAWGQERRRGEREKADPAQRWYLYACGTPSLSVSVSPRRRRVFLGALCSRHQPIHRHDLCDVAQFAPAREGRCGPRRKPSGPSSPPLFQVISFFILGGFLFSVILSLSLCFSLLFFSLFLCFNFHCIRTYVLPVIGPPAVPVIHTYIPASPDLPRPPSSSPSSATHASCPVIYEHHYLYPPLRRSLSHRPFCFCQLLVERLTYIRYLHLYNGHLPSSLPSSSA